MYTVNAFICLLTDILSVAVFLWCVGFEQVGSFGSRGAE